MSILEALASGLPVVATAVGGVSEVVRPGIEGWLVAAGRSPQAFLAVVLEALEDRAALERMRQGLCASPLDRTAVERAARLAPILAEAAHRR